MNYLNEEWNRQNQSLPNIMKLNMDEANFAMGKQGQPRNGSYTFGGSGCFNGHLFIYSGGDTNYQVPEGLPCACGMTKAHYELCPTCGTNLLKPEPNV
jgi:hypothetical protein